MIISQFRVGDQISRLPPGIQKIVRDYDLFPNHIFFMACDFASWNLASPLPPEIDPMRYTSSSSSPWSEFNDTPPPLVLDCPLTPRLILSMTWGFVCQPVTQRNSVYVMFDYECVLLPTGTLRVFCTCREDKVGNFTMNIVSYDSWLLKLEHSLSLCSAAAMERARIKGHAMRQKVEWSYQLEVL